MADQDMHFVFDDCILEIFNLMNNSFSRFALTDMYKKLCEVESV